MYNVLMEYYDFKLLGIERKLPLIQVGKNTHIASFSILGDVQLVNLLARELTSRLKNITFDYLVGPEVRVLPLIHEVAKNLNHKYYVVCRESIKPYMVNPVIVKPLSHFPKHVKPLVINGSDAALLNNKKVIIIDDVVSTGVTIRMIKHLMQKVNAKVVGCYAALKQGEQFDKIENLNVLGELPIFKKNPLDTSTH